MIDAGLIERARAVRIEDEIARRGIKLRGRCRSLRPLPRMRRDRPVFDQSQKAGFQLPPGAENPATSSRLFNISTALAIFRRNRAFGRTCPAKNRL